MNATLPATDRQQEVLAAIVRHAAENGGRMPTIRELCAASGCRSPNGINVHLLALARKGLITFRDGTSSTRNIRVAGLADVLGRAARDWAELVGIDINDNGGGR